MKDENKKIKIKKAFEIFTLPISYLQWLNSDENSFQLQNFCSFQITRGEYYSVFFSPTKCALYFKKNAILYLLLKNVSPSKRVFYSK